MERVCGPESRLGGLVTKHLKRMAAVALQAALPARCYQCASLYQHRVKCGKQEPIFEQLFDPFLCPTCRSDFQAIHSPLCQCCGIPFTGGQGPDHLCGGCEKEPPCFQSARSTGAYQGALRAMIHLLKYRAHAQVAQPLGRLLWATFRQYWPTEAIDMIVPVPLHPRRLRERGFNQALLLLREWPKLALEQGLKRNRAHLAPDLLQRCRPTDPQTGLHRSQRISNLARAFVLAGDNDVRGMSVLLVDDVLTTGATADQCARVLLSAGARAVHVLTLARVV
jgi:ComF family protein